MPEHTFSDFPQLARIADEATQLTLRLLWGQVQNLHMQRRADCAEIEKLKTNQVTQESLKGQLRQLRAQLRPRATVIRAAPIVPGSIVPGTIPSTTTIPPPNRFVIVQQVAAETGYPDSGIAVTDFTQIVAERLHQEDGNWGRRINITGPLGKDTVAYRVNDSDANPFSIDIVLGAAGSDPRLHWSEAGQIGGTWVAP